MAESNDPDKSSLAGLEEFARLIRLQHDHERLMYLVQPVSNGLREVEELYAADLGETGMAVTFGFRDE